MSSDILPTDSRDCVLVTLADREYLPQAMQVFSSAYQTSGWRGDYLLLAHDLLPDEVRWFTDKGIQVFHCTPLFKESCGGCPSVLSSKLYLFTPYFKRWRTIVYLDADTTVCASLDGLTRVRRFSSVPDNYFNLLDSQLLSKDRYAERHGTTADYQRQLEDVLEICDLAEANFCAGMFCFPSLLITEQLFENLYQLLRRYEPIAAYGDQLSLNLFFYKNWDPLPAVYDLYINGNENQWDLDNHCLQGIVLHYVGPSKPWKDVMHFSSLWQEFFAKREVIDLSKRPKGKSWSPLRIKLMSFYLDQYRGRIVRARYPERYQRNLSYY